MPDPQWFRVKRFFDYVPSDDPDKDFRFRHTVTLDFLSTAEITVTIRVVE